MIRSILLLEISGKVVSALPVIERWIWGSHPIVVPVLITGSIRVAFGEQSPTGPRCQDAYHSGQRPKYSPIAGGLALGSRHKITAGWQPEPGLLWLQGTEEPFHVR